jgi:type IV pilus assembly protein PilO
LTVRGGFHGLAGFMSGVAALPRIVTLHDFVIEAEKSDLRALGTKLNMVIKAKTYRYQDVED